MATFSYTLTSVTHRHNVIAWTAHGSHLPDSWFIGTGARFQAFCQLRSTGGSLVKVYLGIGSTSETGNTTPGQDLTAHALANASLTVTLAGTTYALSPVGGSLLTGDATPDETEPYSYDIFDDALAAYIQGLPLAADNPPPIDGTFTWDYTPPVTRTGTGERGSGSASAGEGTGTRSAATRPGAGETAEAEARGAGGAGAAETPQRTGAGETAGAEATGGPGRGLAATVGRAGAGETAAARAGAAEGGGTADRLGSGETAQARAAGAGGAGTGTVPEASSSTAELPPAARDSVGADIISYGFGTPVTGFPVDPGLLEGDGPAFVKVLRLRDNAPSYLWLADNDGANEFGFGAGPEMTPAFEGYAEAITLSASHGSVSVGGPGLAGVGASPDPMETYTWSLSTADQAALVSWLAGLDADDAVAATLRDRAAPPETVRTGAGESGAARAAAVGGQGAAATPERTGGGETAGAAAAGAEGAGHVATPRTGTGETAGAEASGGPGGGHTTPIRYGTGEHGGTRGSGNEGGGTSMPFPTRFGAGETAEAEARGAGGAGAAETPQRTGAGETAGAEATGGPGRGLAATVGRAGAGETAGARAAGAGGTGEALMPRFGAGETAAAEATGGPGAGETVRQLPPVDDKAGVAGDEVRFTLPRAMPRMKPLWARVAAAVREMQETAGTIPPARWGPAFRVGGDAAGATPGTSGVSYGLVRLYTATDSDVAPDPSTLPDGVTWEFAAGAIQGGRTVFGIWNANLAAVGNGQYRWQAVAVAVSREPADVVERAEFDIGLIGVDGAGVEYAFAVTADPNPPSGDDAPDNDWAHRAPAAPWFAAAEEISAAMPYLWRTERTVSGDRVTGDWTSPAIVGRWGERGDDGRDGRDGLDGIMGADGQDGQGREWIFAVTSDPNAPPEAPNNSWEFDALVSTWWSDAAPNLSATDAYLWRSERRVRGASTVTGQWTSPVIVGRFGSAGVDGVDGQDGQDGNGVEYLFAVNASGNRPTPLPENDAGYDLGSGAWTDGAPNVTSANPVLWRCERDVPGTPARGAYDADTFGDWKNFAIVGRLGGGGVDGVDGQDGQDGNGVEYRFAANNSGNAPPLPSHTLGFDSAHATWEDGAPNLTEAAPILWRIQRAVPGTPNQNAAPSATPPANGSRDGDGWTRWRAATIVGRHGDKGDRGFPGVAGSDGSDGNGVEYLFAVNASGNRPTPLPENDAGYDLGSGAWTDGAPNVTSANPVLWRCERDVPGTPARGAYDADTFGDWKNFAIVGRLGGGGVDGVDGQDGQDGNGVEYRFAANNSGNAPPLPSHTLGFDSAHATWEDGAPNLTEAAPILWRIQRAVPGTPNQNAAPSATPPANGSRDGDGWTRWRAATIVGRHGDKGDRGFPGVAGSDGSDGNGVEYLFAVNASGNRPTPLPENDAGYDLGSGAWTDGAPNVTSANPVLWRCERDVPGTPARGAYDADTFGDWKNFAIVGRLGGGGVDGVDGQDGQDGNGVEYRFAANNSGNAPPLPSHTLGFDSAHATWEDGAPNLTEAAPILWRIQRAVPGTPNQNAAPSATPPANGSRDGDGWTRWRAATIVGRHGINGQPGLRGVAGADGGDGNGVEYVFRANNSGNAPSPPLNTRLYDWTNPIDGWSDGAPTISAAAPNLWRMQRRVPGSPTVDAQPEADWGDWENAAIVGRFGLPGQRGIQGIAGGDGTDGNGVEYLFRVAPASTTSVSLPSDTRRFDPASPPADGWFDAAPNVTLATPNLWRTERRVPGSPTANAQPGTAAEGWGQWQTASIVGKYGDTGPAGVDGADAITVGAPSVVVWHRSSPGAAWTPSNTTQSSRVEWFLHGAVVAWFERDFRVNDNGTMTNVAERSSPGPFSFHGAITHTNTVGERVNSEVYTAGGGRGFHTGLAITDGAPGADGADAPGAVWASPGLSWGFPFKGLAGLAPAGSYPSSETETVRFIRGNADGTQSTRTANVTYSKEDADANILITVVDGGGTLGAIAVGPYIIQGHLVARRRITCEGLEVWLIGS